MYRKRAGIHAQLGRQVIRGKRTIAECPEHSDLIGHSGNRQAELGLPQIPNGSVVTRWRQGVHFDIPYNSFVEDSQLSSRTLWPEAAIIRICHAFYRRFAPYTTRRAASAAAG
jgi:hypothetical protein